MSTYKVIQDIEAEDKLLGPLSFRQFIYFLVAAFLGFLIFASASKGFWPAALILGPPMVFCLFFAWPWSPDQPTEVWALARLRFLVKPRKRLWNQSGIKEFVTITVPKKIEKAYTDGLSQDQVRSRLTALSQTIDSRGWAVKNAAYQQATVKPNTDRLVNYDNTTREVSEFDDSDDILDELNNPAARTMEQLIDASSRAHRQQVIDRMNGVASTSQPANWFQKQSSGAVATTATATAAPQQIAATDETEMQTFTPQRQPLHPLRSGTGAAQPVQQTASQSAVPAPQPIDQPVAQAAANPAILTLAHDNNMDIATLAREAKRASGEIDDQNEVVIQLR